MADEKRSAIAPYFSNDKELDTVLKLFNPDFVANMLKNVNPSMRDNAIQHLVFESTAWERRPMNGCVGIVKDLTRKMVRQRAGLSYVEEQIAICKAQFSPEGFVKFYKKHGLSLSCGDDDQDYIDLGPLWDF